MSFEQTLKRLKTRGLVASKSNYLAVDALYNLLKDLYVVPLGTVNTFKRAMMFGIMLIEGVPFNKCREAMENFNLNCLAKQIVSFSKRLKVSSAELIRISDKDLWDIKSEDYIVPLAYAENEDMDSLGNFTRFSKDKAKVLEAIVSLYTEADGTDFTDYLSSKKTAEFYTVTELKAFGFFGNAKTSRAMGIIYSHPDIFVIYYFTDEFPKLEYKTEHSFWHSVGYKIHFHLQCDTNSLAKTIFIGDSMKILMGILRDKRKSTEKILNMNYYDDAVMFVDKSHLGSRQLMYFINERARNEMKEFAYNYFGADTSGYHIGSISNTGTFVIDCTVCNPNDISNVKYISTGKSINTKSVNVMCFDFQMPFIEKYVGDADNVEYYTYDSEKVLGTEDTKVKMLPNVDTRTEEVRALAITKSLICK